jgi:hypothetical protein
MDDEPLMTSGSSLAPFGWSPDNGLTTATVDSVTHHSSQRNSQECGTFVATSSEQPVCHHQPVTSGSHANGGDELPDRVMERPFE